MCFVTLQLTLQRKCATRDNEGKWNEVKKRLLNCVSLPRGI